MLCSLVLKIGFTSESSVVTSDGETKFKIGILSGEVQFGVSIHVKLTTIGPTVYNLLISIIIIIKAQSVRYLYTKNDLTHRRFQKIK